MITTNQQSSNSYKNLIIALLLLISLILGAICIFRPKGISKENFEAVQDSLRTTRDEFGRQKATIKTLEFENERQFLLMKTKDSTISWLQSVVKNFKGDIKNAIVIGITTGIKGVNVTTVTPGDVVRDGDTVKLYPHYSTRWQNKWEQGYILATKDSIHHSIKVTNELEITQGYKRKPLFSFKRVPLEVNVLNVNPNTSTQELRSYSVKNPETRIGLGFNAGVCITGELKPQPYVGIGIQYTVIRLNKWPKR